MPRVTVVIPCFNHGRTLDETVDSVLAQTLADIEIVIVDDGSTDPYTIERLSTFSRERTRLLRTPNRGPSAARNLGVETGTGTYILALDADDLIEPTYLEKAVAVLDAHPELGIVYCLADYFGARSGPWELPEFSWPEALWRNPIFVSAVYRRADWETVGGYRVRTRHTWEDWDFWLTLTGGGVGVYRIPETLFHYRVAVFSRSVDMLADRARSDAANADIVRRHLPLFARHVVAVCENRGVFDRREGPAAWIAVTAMTQLTPVRTYPRRLYAAFKLLAWACLHTRRGPPCAAAI